MSESDSSGWEDDDSQDGDCLPEDDMLMYSGPATCLFCAEVMRTMQLCTAHISSAHTLDFPQSVRGLDTYSYIKLINYTRRHSVDPMLWTGMVDTCVALGDEYLQPVLQDDALLQFDVDELHTDQEVTNTSTCSVSSCTMQLEAANTRAAQAEQQLGRAIGNLNVCKKQISQLMLGSDDQASPTASAEAQSQAAHGDEFDTDGYFNSYAHFGIHEEMLKDHIRTNAYKDFILENPALFKDKVVMDVGCGSGILSMFAARAGARHVVAVDFSEVAYQAMANVKENQLEDVVTVIKGKAEEVTLPNGLQYVDVIISEWMGYFLLYESMMDTVLLCRDKYLRKSTATPTPTVNHAHDDEKPAVAPEERPSQQPSSSQSPCILGQVYPNKCNMFLAGMCNHDLRQSKVGYWTDVHGFKMSSLRKSVVEEGMMQVVPGSTIVTQPAKIAHFDLMSVTMRDLDFEARFELQFSRECELHAIVGFFDIDFEATEHPVYFSTSPHDPPTHWKQTVFWLDKCLPIPCEQHTVKGRIIVKKTREDTRALEVAMWLYGDTEDQVLVKQSYLL